MYLMIVGIYNKYDLDFQSTQDSFFTVFVLLYIKWLIVNIVKRSVRF